MEPKYLVGQDDRDICYPLVHVDGIVGLDVNPTMAVSNQDVPFASPYLITGSKAKVVYFDNILYISAELQFTPAGITYLQEGNTIEVSSSGLNNVENVTLDCFTTAGGAASLAAVYMWTKDNVLYARAVCKERTFAKDPDNPLGVIEAEVLRPFDKVVGNAMSTTKSFAPIKPVMPNGFIMLTFPQRIETMTFYVESTNPIEIETSHGRLTYNQTGQYSYSVSVTNTTKDYTLTLKGNMTVVVYPRDVAVLEMEVRDCTNLVWLSVKDRISNAKMTQNTSLTKFSLYGKHKMYNMSFMMDGLGELREVPNFDTVGVVNMQCTFRGCYKLIRSPYMELRDVTTAPGLFANCDKLTYIPDGMNWSSIIDFTEGFYKCASLLVLPDLNLTSLIYANGMFFSCSSLIGLIMDAPELFETENMYIDCTQLATLTMRGAVRSINLSATPMKTKEVIIAFMSTVGTAPVDRPAELILPQNLALYGFENSFIRDVTAKNWQLRGV